MSLSKAFVDGFLVEWEAGEYAAEVRMMAQKSKALASDVQTHGPVQSPNAIQTARARAVRDRLRRTIQRAPEVMVKITSACKGMHQIGRHLDYISRKGALELEDQDGFILSGRDELRDLREDWRSSGAEPIGVESDRRDTLNIVFSMPAHTDEVGIKRAVRAFAADVFAGNQYVFAYHTVATDPDPNPPQHPHIHLSVKVQGRSGRRLNPRKADLQRWRDSFAEQLRAHGIEANATSRLARLNRDRGVKRSVLAMNAKGQSTTRSRQSDSVNRSDLERLEAGRVAYYRVAEQTLRDADDAEDRLLGLALGAYLDGKMRARQTNRSHDTDKFGRDPSRD